jgi:NADP-dependent 3-hydroxy acid dehydrogenase YdfG
MKEQKTVFITDAATAFGLLNAKLYSEQGWNVVAAVRDPNHAEELNRLDNLLLVKVDMTSREMLEAAVWQTLSQFGSIDEVVNNAEYADTEMISEVMANATSSVPQPVRPVRKRALNDSADNNKPPSSYRRPIRSFAL